MSTGASLLLLVVATIVSGQLLMMMDRHQVLGEATQEPGVGGDALTLLGVGMLLGGALGAVVGSLSAMPVGGAAGAGTGSVIWTAAVIWAHRRPQPPAQHRDES